MGLEFETAEARRIWAEYRRRLAWRDRELPAIERSERMMEAEAHIADAMRDASGKSEAERLRVALDAFGALDAPPPAWRAPVHFTLRYLGMSVVVICGLFALALLHMAAMEVFNPDSVGLYWRPGDGYTLSYENQPDSREVLGACFIPAALAASVALIGIAAGVYRLLSPSASRDSARA
jgi:hypothetical protein